MNSLNRKLLQAIGGLVLVCVYIYIYIYFVFYVGGSSWGAGAPPESNISILSQHEHGCQHVNGHPSRHIDTAFFFFLAKHIDTAFDLMSK